MKKHGFYIIVVGWDEKYSRPMYLQDYESNGAYTAISERDKAIRFHFKWYARHILHKYNYLHSGYIEKY